MHSVFLLSHLHLIYVYMCMGSSRFSCLRHWIRSWYTQQEQCNVFSCCHKSNLRYKITSPDFNNMDMLSTHGLKVKKKRCFILQDVTFTPCRLLFPYFHVTPSSVSPKCCSSHVMSWNLGHMRLTDEKEKAKSSHGVIIWQSVKPHKKKKILPSWSRGGTVWNENKPCVSQAYEAVTLPFNSLKRFCVNQWVNFIWRNKPHLIYCKSCANHWFACLILHC